MANAQAVNLVAVVPPKWKRDLLAQQAAAQQQQPVPPPVDVDAQKKKAVVQVGSARG